MKKEIYYEFIIPKEDNGGIMIIFILGILCGIYGTVVIFMTGFLELQNYIWYVFAFVFFALGKLFKLYLNKRIPLWSVVSVYTLATLGILIFIITVVIIRLSLPKNDEPGLDFLIVLGSKPDMEKNGSEAKYRLDKAIEYIEENPYTMLIISGGITRDGKIEAIEMADYLIENGIDRDNILVEIESHNTRENLIYSKALIDKYNEDMKRNTNLIIINDIGPVLEVEDRPQTIGVLTNDFHIFRSIKAAKKIGYTQVFPISARSNKVLYLHMMMRETFAILKYKFLGYI